MERTTMVVLRTCCWIIGVILSSAASAQIDCDRLRKSDEPFQVTFDVSPGMALPETSQIFRQPTGVTISYRAISTDPDVIKLISRNGFTTSGVSIPPNDRFNPSYEYDIDPANAPFDTMNDVKFRQTVRNGSNEFSYDVNAEFLRADDLIVGSCRLPVRYFHITWHFANRAASPAMVYDAAWSPELKTFLKIVGVRGDKAMYSVPTSISTEFKRLSER
jgi:hypothetical protein